MDKKSRVAAITNLDSSATRLSHKDPWAFRPTLAGGLVLSLPIPFLQFAKHETDYYGLILHNITGIVQAITI
jgi:hypothetical protein